MSEFEQLLENHQRALRNYSAAMDRRNASLAAWADAKTNGAHVEEALAKYRASDDEFNHSRRQLDEASKQLGQAKARRVFEAAMFKPSTLGSARSHST